MPELAAFAEEAQAVDATLATVPTVAWTRPALGSWDVAQLVAHLVRGAGRVAAYLDEPVDGPAVHDRVSYWRYDPDAVAADVARRAVDAAAAVDAETLPALFTEQWRTSAERAAERDPATVMTSIWGPIRLDDYLSTRVVELVVHHLDLRAALDLPPAATPAAARMTMATLEALLGGPRPRNLGRTRFILAATGRIDSDDPRLPVLR